jgi:hypothetical protein
MVDGGWYMDFDNHKPLTIYHKPKKSNLLPEDASNNLQF